MESTVTMCCPLTGSDDSEAASVFASSIVKAAKDHLCSECGEQIVKGTKHEVAKGLWNGAWSTYRTCLLCREIRDHFECDGYIYGQLWSDLMDNFFPDMKAGGPCMDGLSPEAKACLFEARTTWLLDGNHPDHQ